MEYGIVVEGGTKLKVPAGGGISKSEEVFYNPHMALNRDLTVALCRILKPKTFADVMAGCGARGVRVVNEAKVRVTLNDLNPKAVDLIRENAALNGVEADVECTDARSLLIGRRFDYIDLDPFGPPVAYVDSVLSAARWGNIVGVCATDTSALCGSYPKACVRKYDALPGRYDCYNEIGLRILIGFIARSALRHESGIEPLFAHCTRHYMRVQVRLTSRHSVSQRQISFLQYCPECMWRAYRNISNLESKCVCGGRLQTAGPLWNGAYADPQICESVSNEVLGRAYACRSEAAKLLGLVQGEQAVNLPYYDIHQLASRHSQEVPRMSDLGDQVRKAGCFFARTHFSNVGFKTDMPHESVTALLKG